MAFLGVCLLIILIGLGAYYFSNTAEQNKKLESNTPKKASLSLFSLDATKPKQSSGQILTTLEKKLVILEDETIIVSKIHKELPEIEKQLLKLQATMSKTATSKRYKTLVRLQKRAAKLRSENFSPKS